MGWSGGQTGWTGDFCSNKSVPRYSLRPKTSASVFQTFASRVGCKPELSAFLREPKLWPLVGRGGLESPEQALVSLLYRQDQNGVEPHRSMFQVWLEYLWILLVLNIQHEEYHATDTSRRQCQLKSCDRKHKLVDRYTIFRTLWGRMVRQKFNPGPCSY